MSATNSVFSTRLCAVNRLLATIVTAASILISACSTSPLSPYTEDTPPLVLLPASQAGIDDKRGRFREIFCVILEERKATLPDYMPCDVALTQVGSEPQATSRKVELGQRPLLAATHENRIVLFQSE